MQEEAKSQIVFRMEKLPDGLWHYHRNKYLSEKYFDFAMTQLRDEMIYEYLQNHYATDPYGVPDIYRIAVKLQSFNDESEARMTPDLEEELIYQRGYKMGALTGNSPHLWWPTNDYLPKLSGKYLILSQKRINIGTFHNGHFYKSKAPKRYYDTWLTEKKRYQNVTHWQFMPSLPGKKREGDMKELIAEMPK